PAWLEQPCISYISVWMPRNFALLKISRAPSRARTRLQVAAAQLPAAAIDHLDLLPPTSSSWCVPFIPVALRGEATCLSGKYGGPAVDVTGARNIFSPGGSAGPPEQGLLHLQIAGGGSPASGGSDVRPRCLPARRRGLPGGVPGVDPDRHAPAVAAGGRGDAPLFRRPMSPRPSLPQQSRCRRMAIPLVTPGSGHSPGRRLTPDHLHRGG